MIQQLRDRIFDKVTNKILGGNNHRLIHPSSWGDIDWITFIHQRNYRKGNVNSIQNIFTSPFFRLMEILTGIQIWLIRYDTSIGLVYLIPPLLAGWIISEFVDWKYGKHPWVLLFHNRGHQIGRELNDIEMQDVAKADFADMQAKINVIYEITTGE